mmetsp:Transcript_16075/g.33013  ORF Transcript_16075/g.33013 Transcript_16075/m.33013 type:complete len:105 (-) Transcript_16075:83-397(-)
MDDISGRAVSEDMNNGPPAVRLGPRVGTKDRDDNDDVDDAVRAEGGTKAAAGSRETSAARTATRAKGANRGMVAVRIELSVDWVCSLYGLRSWPWVVACGARGR